MFYVIDFIPETVRSHGRALSWRRIGLGHTVEQFLAAACSMENEFKEIRLKAGKSRSQVSDF